MGRCRLRERDASSDEEKKSALPVGMRGDRNILDVEQEQGTLDDASEQGVADAPSSLRTWQHAGVLHAPPPLPWTDASCLKMQ
mmetsp:Transcript_12112/g.20989  ORF Transcript_12112/g.20989 Transcript_12112/m.20989 type:complete len:83 (+) Transcript_12112:408-656(+)